MGAVVYLAFGRQEARAAKLHPPHSKPDAVQEGAARESQTAPTLAEGRLRRSSHAQGKKICPGEILTNNAKLKNTETHEKTNIADNRSNWPAGSIRAGQPDTIGQQHSRRSRRDIENVSTAQG